MTTLILIANAYCLVSPQGIVSSLKQHNSQTPQYVDSASREKSYAIVMYLLHI